jgi:uncharacterized protein (UPF0335 family)
MATVNQLQKRLSDKKAKVERLTEELKTTKGQMADIKDQLKNVKGNSSSKVKKTVGKAKKAVKKKMR